MSNSTVIVTSTFYTIANEVRAELSKKLIQDATELRYEIVVVDDGSPEVLLDEYRKLGAKVYTQKNRGMGNGRREAIQIGTEMDKDFLIYLDPEKVGMISKIQYLEERLKTSDVGIVIPRRKSLETYPEFQQQSELLGNLFWKELTRKDLDVYFGPRIWRKELSHYFLEYDGKYGDKWDSIFIPLIDMIKDGVELGEIDVDYIHPVEQTKLEEHNLDFHMKRIEQLQTLSKCLLTHWNMKL